MVISAAFIFALALFMARRITKSILSAIIVSRENAMLTEKTSQEMSEASSMLAEGYCEQVTIFRRRQVLVGGDLKVQRRCAQRMSKKQQSLLIIAVSHSSAFRIKNSSCRV